MTNELLSKAHSQADRSSAAVRVAARMRIARVESVTHPDRARITFEMALAEIQGFPGRARRVFLQHAQEIAAAIAPDLLREIHVPASFPAEHHAETILSIMLNHGHIDAALVFVLNCHVLCGFPFGFAANLMPKLNQERRVSLLRSAIDAWRAPRDAERVRGHRIPLDKEHFAEISMRQLQGGFIRLFGLYWTILPSEDSLAVVREIVHSTLELPDFQTSASYPEGIHFTSCREHILFEVFHVLRHLDPLLAESLVARHAQLALAVARYVNGAETMRQEAEQEAEER